MVVPSSGANLSLPATLEIIVRRIADARALESLPELGFQATNRTRSYCGNPALSPSLAGTSRR